MKDGTQAKNIELDTVSMTMWREWQNEHAEDIIVAISFSGYTVLIAYIKNP